MIEVIWGVKCAQPPSYTTTMTQTETQKCSTTAFAQCQTGTPPCSIANTATSTLLTTSIMKFF